MLRVLERAGFEATAVESGESAMSWCAAHQSGPLALVIDYSLPDVDGASLIRQIRASHRPHIRVAILLTGSAEQVPADDGALFDLVLSKPFSMDELTEHISRLSVPPNLPE